VPEKIQWTLNLQVPGGPRLAQTGVLDVEAYDKVSVTLEVGGPGVNVDVQPATAAGQVTLLALTASAYDPALTYSVDEGTTTIPLEAPVALIGAGAVGLLDPTPQRLHLDNGTNVPQTFEILVGRAAALLPATTETRRARPPSEERKPR